MASFAGVPQNLLQQPLRGSFALRQWAKNREGDAEKFYPLNQFYSLNDMSHETRSFSIFALALNPGASHLRKDFNGRRQT